MLRYVCFILLVCSFCLKLNAQNPFDLQSRLGGNAVEKTDTAVDRTDTAVDRTDTVVIEEVIPRIEDTLTSEPSAVVVDSAANESTAIPLGSVEPEIEPPPDSEEEVTEVAKPVPLPKTAGFFQSMRQWNNNLTQNLRSSATPGSVSRSQNLLFGISLFILLLLAVLMVLNRRMLRDAYRAMSNDNYLRFLFRDYQNKLWIYRTFYLYFFINAGFFIYLTVNLAAAQSRPSIAVLPIAVGLILLVYFVRHTVLQIIGSSFPVSKETELFGFIIMLINIVFGLVLTPINLGLAFGPIFLLKPLIYTGLGLFIFLYIFRQLKGLFLSSRLLGTYLFHFFLYFCIVEIAPLLVIGKLASTHLGVH